jgi:hypothetical protein
MLKIIPFMPRVVKSGSALDKKRVIASTLLFNNDQIISICLNRRVSCSVKASSNESCGNAVFITFPL